MENPSAAVLDREVVRAGFFAPLANEATALDGMVINESGSGLVRGEAPAARHARMLAYLCGLHLPGADSGFGRLMQVEKLVENSAQLLGSGVQLILLNQAGFLVNDGAYLLLALGIGPVHVVGRKLLRVNPAVARNQFGHFPGCDFVLLGNAEGIAHEV